MSFGQPISVERRVPVQGYANGVLLAPFDVDAAAKLFPVPANDPALQFMPQSVRDERTAPHEPGDNLAFSGYNIHDKLAWGVYADEQLIGAAALSSTSGRNLDLDIHLGSERRLQGVDELVLAGLTRAAFTRGYVSGQNPELIENPRPWLLNAWAHRDNRGLKELLKTFGFTYASYRRLEPGFVLSRFELVGGVCHGVQQASAQTAATLKAARKLSEFQVRAEGRVQIPDKPNELFDRLTYY